MSLRYWARRILFLGVLVLLADAQLAIAQSGLLLYVPNSGGDSVSVFRTNADGSLTAVTTITAINGGGNSSPFNAAVRRDQAFAYVTLNTEDLVAVIDTLSNTVVQFVATGDGPRGIEVSPDGMRVYVANNSTSVTGNSVSIFTADPITGQLTAGGIIPTGANSNPRSLALSPDGSTLYVVNQGTVIGGGDSVHVVNTSTNTITTTISVGDQPIWISVSPAGTRAYVSNFFTTISVIDTATNTVVASPAVSGAKGVAVSPDGAYFYVTRNDSNLIEQFDAATNTFVSSVAFSGDSNSRPSPLTFSPSGATAYAVDNNSFIDEVRALSVASGTGALSALDVDPGGNAGEIAAICGNGNTLLAAGRTFVANTAAALGCTGGTPTFTGGTLRVNALGLVFPQNFTFNSPSFIDTNGYDAEITGALLGGGGFTNQGIGWLTLSGTAPDPGPITIASGLRAGAAIVFGSSSATTVNTFAVLDLNNFNWTLGSLAGAAASDVALGSGTLTVGGNNSNTTFSGVISGAGGLVKTGSGNMVLTGANNYTGGTTISGGTLSGTTTGLQGNITNNGVLSFNQAGNGTFAGAISGSGSMTKDGAGIVTLTGSNTFTGGTTVNVGTLRAGVAGTFAAFGSMYVTLGSVLDLNSFNQTIGSLSGDGTVTLGAATLTAGGNNFTTTFSGVINGGGGLIKIGTGMLVLTGTNNYTGSTVVNAGFLHVTGAAIGLSAVSVASGATLRGNGSIAGPVTVNGLLSPGASAPGQLSTGSLVLNG